MRRTLQNPLRHTKHLVGAARPIPRSVYDSVLQLSVEIVNSTMRGQPLARRRAYRRLKRFCLLHAKDLAARAFLLETLADFTSPRRIAIPLYRSALRAAAQAGDQQHTILISLAQRLFERGSTAEVKQCLRRAVSNATRWRDTEDVRTASQLLKELREGTLDVRGFLKASLPPEENGAA